MLLELFFIKLSHTYNQQEWLTGAEKSLKSEDWQVVRQYFQLKGSNDDPKHYMLF